MAEGSEQSQGLGLAGALVLHPPCAHFQASAARVQASIPRDHHTVSRIRCASLNRSCSVGGCGLKEGLDQSAKTSLESKTPAVGTSQLGPAALPAQGGLVPLNTVEAAGSETPGCRQRKDPPGCHRVRCGTAERGFALPLGWTQLRSTQEELKREQSHQGRGNTLH